ncbi:PREDICTED: uncharacterized protein LOC105147034 [Acromyrmex echinatior]|uniref:Uncharacterized protein n=1 Tax=Acromyrmex echinatior TaxID=103372 RepID=F4WMR0_ACREC|nr:PREDICTED: uncharacterized protein LOC105147034 [Acromyrmex echinatior]EGI64537.1 hypothetical protein G5I_07044 [Acromyrmex echinatior]
MFAIFALLFSIVFASDKSLNRTDLKCAGFAIHNVSLSAYYPVFETDDKRNYLDDQGNGLKTLQDYLDGRARYVTVAGNLKSGIPYGTKICIEELNEQFGKQIPLQIRDQSDYESNKLIDFSRLEICVRTEEDTYDKYLNDFVTIYI